MPYDKEMFSDFGVLLMVAEVILEDRRQSQNAYSAAIYNSINICPISPQILGIDRKSSS
jgi:hypothetical protein